MAKRALILLFIGLMLVCAAAAYAWLATNYSGRLVLAQEIPAAQAARGFNFGPVYLEQGEVGRYRISALMPQTEEDYWYTTFEVLNDQQVVVYQQDELRFIGDYQFTPGELDTYTKAFAMDKASGYYFFRFNAVNGVYDANPEDRPVVSFQVRQRVIHGVGLWLPVAGALGLGLLLAVIGIRLIVLLGRRAELEALEEGGSRLRPRGTRRFEPGGIVTSRR
ncbi:MAG TPA: hypothetical protein ENO21_03535 [Firmicutes bacterium]|nr:hypothetical protein [Bacillota bacterium]